MPAHFQPMANQIPPPQARLHGSRPYRATYDPKRLPVPFIPFPLAYLTDPRFAPGPPSRGFYLWDEIPRVKLRGLGPADSLILRHAVALNFFNPARLLLAPLLPGAPPDLPTTDFPDTDTFRQAPDAYLQPDALLHAGLTKKWADAPTPPPAPAGAAGSGPFPKPPGSLVIEVKPNAGYVALGQVLCYHFVWMEHYAADWPLEPAILTDLPRPYLPRLAAAYGVSLYALGHLIVEPPPWPT